MRSTEIIEIVVGEAGRADSAIAGAIEGLSRTRVQSLIKAGAVELNGSLLADPSRHVAAGDEVRVKIPPPEPATPRAEAIALDVLYEDEALIVIDKPAGLVVHPAAGHASGTLVNALIAHCGASLSGIGGVMRPGIVHRLDKDTSGVMVVAKTDGAHAALAAQFADHGRTGPLERRYDALVWGTPKPPEGTVDRPLGRHLHDRQRFAVRSDGKRAITHYATLATLVEATHISCELETGRTHQIRVHMASIGTPIVADPLYSAGFATKANRLSGPAREAIAALGRQALHASHLAFAHPQTGSVMRFQTPMPHELRAVHDALAAG